MKIFIEFAHKARDIAKRDYLWIEIPYDSIQIRDLLLKVLSTKIGEEASRTIYELFSKREIYVYVNGRVVHEDDYMLKDLDKVYLVSLAFGG